MYSTYLLHRISPKSKKMCKVLIAIHLRFVALSAPVLGIPIRVRLCRPPLYRILLRSVKNTDHTAKFNLHL